jgi:FixJ family two-component response regulator
MGQSSSTSFVCEDSRNPETLFSRNRVESKPKCVLLDFKLPQVSGLEVKALDTGRRRGEILSLRWDEKVD